MPTSRRLDLENWLWKFVPDIEEFYKKIFSKKPEKMSERNWADLKHRIGMDTFNRLMPHKKEEKEKAEKVKPVEIIFKDASKNIPPSLPGKSPEIKKEIRVDVDRDSGGQGT